jgi:hypothetical protein
MRRRIKNRIISGNKFEWYWESRTGTGIKNKVRMIAGN